MFLNFSSLDDNPFRITPDSRYLYLSERHARARSYMESAGFLTDGFVVITGDVGSGKTILVNDFLSGLQADVVVVKIHQTQISPVQFLQAFLAELGFEPFNMKKAELLNVANTFLLRNYAGGKRVILVIDEAQHLSLPVLEEIRLLAGIENGNQRILNVILAGQPGFREKLLSPRMEQLAQRTPLHFHLAPLDIVETEAYIEHRLKVAGDAAGEVFSAETIPVIYRHTHGVPRLINSLCNTALLCAFADDQTVVAMDSVNSALEELQWSGRDAAVDQQARPVADRTELARTSDAQEKIIANLRSDLENRTAKIESLQDAMEKKQESRSRAPNPRPVRADVDKETMVLSETINALKRNFAAEKDSRSKLGQRFVASQAENTRLAEELTLKQKQIEAYEHDHAESRIANLAADGQGATTVPQVVVEPLLRRELVPLNNGAAGKHRIGTGQLRLGSHPDNDIQIRSGYISAHHAQIVSNSQESVLGDLNSTNGTYVNSKRIERHALRDGDAITIGKHRFRYVDHAASVSEQSLQSRKSVPGYSGRRV